MELNNIENHDHASVSMKVIMLVFVLILVGVLGYFVWVQNTTVDTTDNSTVVKKSTSSSSTSTSTATPAADENLVACGDTAKYGFDLTFGAKWTGHKVTEVLEKDMVPQPGYAVVTCYFTMSTTSTETVWTTAAIDHPAKSASVFAVSVYTPAQWITAQEDPNKSTELGHNASYYWGWIQAQAIPTDLDAVYADAKNVVATFKIAE